MTDCGLLVTVALAHCGALWDSDKLVKSLGVLFCSLVMTGLI